jgi:alkylhydroperoxidase/carboxymuconolactone decarboxylase family protein YurZ
VGTPTPLRPPLPSGSWITGTRFASSSPRGRRRSPLIRRACLPSPQLAPRDRSLITVASVITCGNTEQLRAHLGIAKQNGLTETELKEAIIHLALYAGWPKAMSAITAAKEVFND